MEVLAWTTAMIAGLSILVQALAAGLGAIACQAAATHALQATRVAGGSPAAGTSDALLVLDQTAGRLVRGPHVDVTRTPGAASTVHIAASAISVLPGIRIPLSATSTGPTEPAVIQP